VARVRLDGYGESFKRQSDSVISGCRSCCR
jgi:hypothetical protein